MSIKYIDIEHSYIENISYHYKHTTIEEHINTIKNIDNSFSRFEVIENYATNKIYFDIEGIEHEKDKLIFDIVAEIINKLNIFFYCERTLNNDNVYKIITENINSHGHEGRSYHVILSNVYTRTTNLKDFVNYYISHEFYGYQYIDNSVYSSNRLFRCVNQPGIDKKVCSYDADLLTDDMHKIIYNNIPNIKNDDELLKASVIAYTDDTRSNYLLSRGNIPYSEIKACNKKAKKLKNKFSNNFMNTPTKQIFIFNGDVSKDVIEDINGIINRKEERKTGKEEYDKAVILLELSDNLNDKMKSILNEIIDYYKTNNSFDNFRLTIDQIRSLETIIETKI